MSLKIEDVIETLKRQKLDQKIIEKVTDELEQIEEENKAEKAPAGPKQKKQFVIVVRGDESMKGKSLAGWVAQMNEGDDPSTLLSRMTKAAEAHNAAQKRKKHIVTSVADAFQYIKRKFSKEQNYLVKTKEYVQVVIVTEDQLDKN